MKLKCNNFRGALHNIDARIMSAEDNRLMHEHFDECLHCQEYHAVLMKKCTEAGGVKGEAAGILFIIVDEPLIQGNEDADVQS